MELVERIKTLAARKGCSAAQLALAWVLAQGHYIVPIPGTKRRPYLEENIGALDVHFGPEELAEIDTILPAGVASGSRYSRACGQLIGEALNLLVRLQGARRRFHSDSLESN